MYSQPFFQVKTNAEKYQNLQNQGIRYIHEALLTFIDKVCILFQSFGNQNRTLIEKMHILPSVNFSITLSHWQIPDYSFSNLYWDGTPLNIWSDVTSHIWTVPHNACMEMRNWLQPALVIIMQRTLKKLRTLKFFFKVR